MQRFSCSEQCAGIGLRYLECKITCLFAGTRWFWVALSRPACARGAEWSWVYGMGRKHVMATARKIEGRDIGLHEFPARVTKIWMAGFGWALGACP